MNYVSEKSITLKELMRIKDICRSHLSNHYMLTPSDIQHHLGMKIKYQVKCVLLKKSKGIGTMTKNWIVFNFCQGRLVHYLDIFHYLDKEFDLNPQTQKKFAERV